MTIFLVDSAFLPIVVVEFLYSGGSPTAGYSAVQGCAGITDFAINFSAKESFL